MTKSKKAANDSLISRRGILGAAIALGGVSSKGGESELPRYRLCLNEDNSHFFLTRHGQLATKATALKLVDQYAETQVDALMICPNAQRVGYDSKVWEPAWRGFEPGTAAGKAALAHQRASSQPMAAAYTQTTWDYYRAGLDVYALWTERCRERKISPWLSVRMNDGHDLDYVESFLHSDFWRTHPEYWISQAPDRNASRAFDYAHKEVRDHYLALITELVNRYDVDGVELDWMRDTSYFKPGQEEEGRTLLSAFVQQVREILKRREGAVRRRIRLGVRVPSRPQTAKLMGFDVQSWASQGLVDHVVATARWATSETDMPIEEWKAIVGKARFAAGLELSVRPYPAAPMLINSLETARGMAAGFLTLGADEIYLFNYMDSGTTISDPSHYSLLVSECGSLETLQGKPRRHIVTYSDVWGPGEKPFTLLPFKGAPGASKVFRVACGPKPQQGAFVRLGVPGVSSQTAGAWTVRCSGQLCAFSEIVSLAPVPSPAIPLAAFRVPQQAFGAFKGGRLPIEVTLPKDGDSARELHWLELYVAG